MNFKQKIILTFFILFFIFAFLFFKLSQKPPQVTPPDPVLIEGKVKYPVDYLLVLVGDSMTEYLGNFDELKANLKTYYPQKSFDILNYGFGSTNILTLNSRLLEKTQHGREFRPITEIDFDLILIESFGHNPLSHLSLEDGLKQQTESLKNAIQIIKEKNPKAKIIFIATLAPSTSHYGKGQVELSSGESNKWAKEREEYIKNHIKFAENNNIPIINIFEKSKIDGDLNLDLVRKEDYIHPSPTGVIFISKEIADFIFNNQIL